MKRSRLADRKDLPKKSLSLRTRKRVKRPSHTRIVQAGPDGPYEQWAMDFVSDSLMGVGGASGFWQLPIYGIVQAPRSK